MFLLGKDLWTWAGGKRVRQGELNTLHITMQKPASIANRKLSVM